MKNSVTIVACLKAELHYHNQKLFALPLIYACSGSGRCFILGGGVGWGGVGCILPPLKFLKFNIWPSSQKLGGDGAIAP